jgi:hypothetical protein
MLREALSKQRCTLALPKRRLRIQGTDVALLAAA